MARISWCGQECGWRYLAASIELRLNAWTDSAAVHSISTTATSRRLSIHAFCFCAKLLLARSREYLLRSVGNFEAARQFAAKRHTKRSAS